MNCEHIDKLVDMGIIDKRLMMNMEDGKETKHSYLLYEIKEGANGRLFVPVNYKYVVVSFCPICGTKVEDGK